MKKRNLIFGFGGIFGTLLDLFLTALVIMFTLLLKSCVGESGNTTKLDILASVICLVLIFSIVAAIITAIRGFGARKVPLIYIIIQQAIHLIITIACVISSIGGDLELLVVVIATLCVVHIVIYIFGLAKQNKILKSE